MSGFRPADTSGSAWELTRAAHARLGPEGRLRAAFEASAFVRAIAREGIQARYPEPRGSSDRQLRDVAAVLAANRETLDLVYLRRQARELGVDALLRQMLGEASSGGAPA